MSDTVTISREEYDALVSASEDAKDMATYHKHLKSPDEMLPSSFVDRMLDGEHVLKLWREHRGYNQSSLAAASCVNRVQIADIEAGRSSGSVGTFKKLAEALDVTIDDLV